MKKIKFKQSRNWWQDKDLDWFIDNAAFVFTNSGYKGYRPRIVTKQKLNGMDCFEIDNDGCGIVFTSETEFSPALESMIKTRSENVPEFISEFLIGYGAGEFVNPKLSVLKSIGNALRRKKDKFILVNA